MRAVASERLVREIRSHHFAVLATAGSDGSPHAAGVSYGATVEDGRVVIYVMTRRHLRKARDIASRPSVSLVIPIERRVLWVVPPATIQLSGRAELLSQDDASGLAVFARFALGRRIVASYSAMARHGERRVCFVRIAIDADARSYLVGVGLPSVIRRMEAGAARTRLNV